MKGFRLISLTLKTNYEYPEGHYEFTKVDSKINKSNPFTTLIIGPNGAGKSRLIKLVLDIFNDLYNIKNQLAKELTFKHYFLIKYQIENQIITIEHFRGELTASNNSRNLEIGIFDVPLPNKGIVAAYSIYDKFTPKRINSETQNLLRKKTKYENNFYEYLGTKTERNFTFSGSYINKSVDMITEALSQQNFSKDLSHVFALLKLQPKLFIKYKLAKVRELFINEINSVEELKDTISKITFRSAGFSYNKLLNLRDSDDSFLKTIIISIKKVKEILNSNLEIPIELLFGGKNENNFFIDKYKHISLLLNLNLIRYDKIFIYKLLEKNDVAKELELRSMSSGEIQIITSMLALSSIVEENSLIIIDEPEISLHPNWQIKFIDLLCAIFKKYPTCHFLIATHSHFLVSDLKPESSSLLALVKDDEDNISPELLNYDTYGWTAENILYNIFNVATVRNHYFEMDLRNLLSIISSNTKSRNTLKVKEYIRKFENFNIHNNDPLKLIIKEAKKYLNED